MPIYEYKCRKCGEKFEVLLRLFQSDKTLKCPKCGDKDVEKVFSPFATDSSSSCGGSGSFHSFG